MILQIEEYQSLSCVNDLSNKMNNDPYRGTPFEAARNLSSRSKGAFFEKLVKEYLKYKFPSLMIRKPFSSDHDTIMNDCKIEIKGSTLWCSVDGTPTHFRWQQIRNDQDYDIMVFVAMYPNEVKFFYTKKKQLINNPDLKNQHGGKNANSGTMFVDGYPEDFSWMKEIKDESFVS